MNRVIIDVREPREYQQGHITGAINLPLSELANAAELPDISKDCGLILHCNSGHRAGIAATILKQKGYTAVINGVNQGTVAAHYLHEPGA